MASGRGGDAGMNYRLPLACLPPDLRRRAIDLWPELAEEPVPGVPAGGRTGKPIRRRSDLGKPRVLVGRNWDRDIDLPSVAKAAIAAELDQRVRRLWASRASRAGWRTIQRFASEDLYELSREAGSAMPDAELWALCMVPQRFITTYERRKHRRTDMFRHDAKAFNDALPNVLRKRPERPLECVVGDGTPLDINVLRPDGTQWKVWLILWLDWATGRLFGHAYARPKGRGVRQQHIAYSLAVLASEIGMPETVYLDRGGEYNALRALSETGLADVIRALPYNARSKVIEPAIRVLVQQYLALIPGFMGGDRLKPLIETVGKPTEAYPGTIQALFADLERAIAVFNATPRDGRDGRSATDLWQAAVNAGWRPAKADLATLTEVMSRPLTRTVKRGAIRIGNHDYTSDSLTWRFDLEGERVTVQVPIDPELGWPPAVYDPAGAFVGLVQKKLPFQWNDPAGAHESTRLKALRRQGARALEDEAPPADVARDVQKFLERHGPPPDPPAGEIRELAGERGRAAEARRLSGAQIGSPPPSPAEEPEPDYYDMLEEVDRKRSAQ